jgi:ubiquinone/menaquinone biosynthesis C-methylase UbiE
VPDDERGLVFDHVAEDYDRVRRGYPPELVDAAFEIAGLAPGGRVLEVGCGTGKLTRVLAERGLQVDAVDPGAQLVQVARRHVGDAAVHFRVARFEDVELPEGAFDAVVSATAFHWIDPVVGWSKVARLLRAGGTLALLAHTFEPEPEMLAAWREFVREADAWVPRDLRTLWEGADARMGNISELWAWLMNREIARPEAAALFRDVQLRKVRIEAAETAGDLVALIRTTSSYLRLDPELRVGLEERIAGVVEGMGGTYRPALFAVLATARTA